MNVNDRYAIYRILIQHDTSGNHKLSKLQKLGSQKKIKNKKAIPGDITAPPRDPFPSNDVIETDTRRRRLIFITFLLNFIEF